MKFLAGLRLCSNVPGQWAVQMALGGFQSIKELVRPGGRVYQSRQAVVDEVANNKFLSMTKPMGAMYAFIKIEDAIVDRIDDQTFAIELLENTHVLVGPGSSFNTPYMDHFRITTLPDPDIIHDVFSRIESLRGEELSSSLLGTWPYVANGSSRSQLCRTWLRNAGSSPVGGTFGGQETCDVFLKFQLSPATGCAGSYMKETGAPRDRRCRRAV